MINHLSTIISSNNHAAELRQWLTTQKNFLFEQFRHDVPVEELVQTRSETIDYLLTTLWQKFAGEISANFALIAVGGYGRGELHPHSDIDLLLLHQCEFENNEHLVIERFITLLWDIGLEVGNSVRTLTECIEQASADVTIATNLMESRLLIGNQQLYTMMREATHHSRIWPSHEFFKAKRDEQRKRHSKFYDTAYNLEPNIKEGPGGLRDIQNVGWVAKRHFDAEDMHELVIHNFLTADEYIALVEGQNFLWKIRFALHMNSGRREDRLLFDQQRLIAEQFGYQDSDEHLAVEHFMKHYYRTITELERLNEMLLQLYAEELLPPENPTKTVTLSKRYSIRNRFIEVLDDRVFKRYPFALLEIFLMIAQHPEVNGVRAGTIRLIRNHLDLINDKFRADLGNRAIFMELLRQPRGITYVLRRMNRYGVLAAYLPEFGAIVGQMQHDLFHVYTVDEHTIRVVRNLRRLTAEKYFHEFPVCSEIISRIPKPELLYIAALYHDIAKGRGGDHSQLGSEMVKKFCERHLLSTYDSALVIWLVKNHLLMSMTAQRKDITDPDIIYEFASIVGNQNYLDYLYLLTTSDIRATSPTVWNSWKDSLLLELYQQSTTALSRGLATPVNQQQMIEFTQYDAIELLEDFSNEEILSLWDRMGDDYFIRYTASEIAWHTQNILEYEQQYMSGIFIRQNDKGGGTEIFIHTPIQDGLFSKITATLDLLNLNIVDARILASHDHYTLDTYVVIEENGTPIDNIYRIDEIKSRLYNLLDGEYQPPSKIGRPIPRQLKHFQIPANVYIYPAPNKPWTILEVVATDQPGLLSQLAKVIFACNVSLLNAKIATLGERVEDIFFVSTFEGKAIEDEPTIDCLRHNILTLLNAHTGG